MDFRLKEDLALSTSSLLFVATARPTVLELETLSFSIPSVEHSDFSGSATLTKVQGWDKKNKSAFNKISEYLTIIPWDRVEYEVIITNERVARVDYDHFISKKVEWNNCFSIFLIGLLPPIFISTILQCGKILNLAHYFPY